MALYLRAYLKQTPNDYLFVKGTTTGTTTDQTGHFMLSISSKSTLVFSFIGYASVEKPVQNQTTFNIDLSADTKGFRSNDLRRNLLPLPAKSSSSNSAPVVQPSQSNYTFPLPNTEITTNKLLLS